MNLKTGLLDHANGQKIALARKVGFQKDINVRLGLSLFGALQPYDERNVHLKLFSGLDDTLSDVVATHDTTEDVDEDALDLGVRAQDLEGLLDGLGGSTSEINSSANKILPCHKHEVWDVPSDIKEVGRVASVE